MDTGDTAWMLASTALVLLMVPGLAFFYGGMVRAKSGLKNISLDTLTGTHPTYIFVIFQMLFCVVTIGLVAGAIADRARFAAWMVFVPLWVTLVYVPVAHWVFAFDGDTTKG